MSLQLRKTRELSPGHVSVTAPIPGIAVFPEASCAYWKALRVFFLDAGGWTLNYRTLLEFPSHGEVSSNDSRYRNRIVRVLIRGFYGPMPSTEHISCGKSWLNNGESNLHHRLRVVSSWYLQRLRFELNSAIKVSFRLPNTADTVRKRTMYTCTANHHSIDAMHDPRLWIIKHLNIPLSSKHLHNGRKYCPCKCQCRSMSINVH